MREKALPELDDEFASEASEFETLDELRGEIRATHRARRSSSRADEQFREAAVDAAVDDADVEIPDDIVRSRAPRSSSTASSTTLGHRGIDPEAFMQMQGRPRDELVADVQPRPSGR